MSDLPEPVAWWVCDANDKSSGALWSHEPTAENLQWIKNQTSRKHISVKLQDAEAAVDAAVAQERERCAKLCEAAKASIWPYHSQEVIERATAVCDNLAAAIRSTPTEPKRA